MSLTGKDVVEWAKLYHDLHCPLPANQCDFTRTRCCMPYINLIMTALKIGDSAMPDLLTSDGLGLMLSYVLEFQLDKLDYERGITNDRTNEWASLWEESLNS